MKKKIIALCISGMLCIACVACTKTEYNGMQDSMQNQNAEDSLIDRKGSTDVPKTEKEIISGDGMEEFKDASQAEEKFGDSFSTPDIDGYTSLAFLTEDSGIIKTVYTKASATETVSISKSRDELHANDVDAYAFSYPVEKDGISMVIGSRIGEDYVGSALWSADGYNYLFETSAWDELPLDDALEIISGVK